MVHIIDMQKMNIHGLDLNLLPPLEALLRRRNVSLAADDAGMSQPAMSRALGRLRELLDDPLLLRSGKGFVLTAKAEDLRPRLAAMLGQAQDIFSDQPFDPLVERRTIRIAALDNQNIMLMPKVLARLRREAPGVDLQMVQYGPDIAAKAQAGEIDLVFALHNSALPPGAMSEIIAQDKLVLVMRAGHPAAGRPWKITDYGNYDHVSISILGDGRSDLDAELAARGVSRRIGLVTPHFMAALAAVSETDMVTTLSEAFANRFAGVFNLVLQAPPLAQVDLQLALAWSQVKNNDRLLTWLRGVIGEVARETHGLAQLT
jgi:DNA-binding transcriptional LysR family regulator